MHVLCLDAKYRNRGDRKSDKVSKIFILDSKVEKTLVKNFRNSA